MNEFSYILQQKAGFYFFLASCYSKIKIDMETPPTLCVGVWQAVNRKKAMVYACSSHQQGLQKAFSILAEPDAGVHPATWSSEMAALKGKHSVELFEWKPHEPA